MAIPTGAAVLRANGSVVEVVASVRGPVRRQPRVPPMRFIAASPNGALCGATRRGGEVHCWNGFVAGEQRPRRIEGVTRARRIALRDSVGAAVLEDATVRTFGDGGASDFGTGMTDESFGDGRVERPVGLVDVVDVTATAWSFCALVRDGTVRCWGDRLGAEGAAESAPVPIGGLDGVISVHGGGRLLCARRRDRSVACMGEGVPGLPTASAGDKHAAPVLAPMAEGALDLAIGQGHACWLAADGSPRCAGENDAGQVGVMPRRTVVSSVPGVARATWISAWGALSCAGGPWGTRCWGAGQWSLARELPRPLTLPSIADVRAAWVTETDACVLRAGGVRECFADVSQSPRSLGRLEGVAAIAGPCAEMRDGRVLCGVDAATTAELPDGPHRTLVARPVYAAIEICAVRRAGDRATCATFRVGEDGRPALSDVVSLFVGAPDDLTAGAVPCIREADEVACYPRNRDPYGIAGAFDELEGGSITCARAGRSVSCWGYIDVAQLVHISGVAHPDASEAPTRIPGVDDATALAVGDGHACALRATGEVACFGDTRSGGVGGVPGWVALEPVTPQLDPFP